MDNFQNNNNLNNNENGQEQNNTQSSFSYDYAKNDTINTSGTVVEEKPKKKKKGEPEKEKKNNLLVTEEGVLAVHDFNLEIKDNEFIVLVGPSGCGKSTTLRMIAGLEEISGGELYIGGQLMNDVAPKDRDISMVFQNVYLFHDTIRANILFGKPDATEEEMIKAAKKARCHDFIMALPDGYDTVVGEGGGTLSGGEKQRISIARAILKNAPIIILDEATASIDPENEHLIQQAISELTRGKTIITIAHRLATIQNADQILVVADGRIAEHGTHAELVQQDGLYRRFTAIREQAEGWRIAAK